MTILLGIVGSPAGGKSTAAKILSQWGACWINADLIAKDCLTEPDVISALTDRFGEHLLDSDGQIVRRRLADLVFGSKPENRAALDDLESIVHPRVRVEIRNRIIAAARQHVTVTLLDVPLLFESGWDRSCDAIWCIDATRSIRLSRAEKRNWDSLEMARRESHQLAIETKCRLSNLVMRNDSTLDALGKKLRQAWDLLARIKVDEHEPGRERIDDHCLSDWPTGH